MPILNKSEYDCSMDTLSRLKNLVGKRGLLNIANHGDVEFTFLSVDPVPDLPAETDSEAFQRAINLSSFQVRFNNGIRIEGTDTISVSGLDISRIFGDY